MAIMTRRNVLLAGGALAWAAASHTAEAATGSIELKIVSAGFIVGAGGGGGVLVFEGKRYPLSVGGISAGASIGASSAELVGTASNLHEARDIEGVYSAISAGVAVAGGASAAQLSNARGVVLRLRGRQVGFKFGFDLSGLTIGLK
jgi:hypothetical protein